MDVFLSHNLMSFTYMNRSLHLQATPRKRSTDESGILSKVRKNLIISFWKVSFAFWLGSCLKPSRQWYDKHCFCLSQFTCTCFSLALMFDVETNSRDINPHTRPPSPLPDDDDDLWLWICNSSLWLRFWFAFPSWVCRFPKRARLPKGSYMGWELTFFRPNLIWMQLKSLDPTRTLEP